MNATTLILGLISLIAAIISIFSFIISLVTRWRTRELTKKLLTIPIYSGSLKIHWQDPGGEQNQEEIYEIDDPSLRKKGKLFVRKKEGEKVIKWSWKKEGGWAGWGIKFGKRLDLSNLIYTHALEFYIKGLRGGEKPYAVILEGYNEELVKLRKDNPEIFHKSPEGVQAIVKEFVPYNIPRGKITTSWQKVTIPLSDFNFLHHSLFDEYKLQIKSMNWEEITQIIFQADWNKSEDTVYLAAVKIIPIEQ